MPASYTNLIVGGQAREARATQEKTKTLHSVRYKLAALFLFFCL